MNSMQAAPLRCISYSTCIPCHTIQHHTLPYHSIPFDSAAFALHCSTLHYPSAGSTALCAIKSRMNLHQSNSKGWNSINFTMPSRQVLLVGGQFRIGRRSLRQSLGSFSASFGFFFFSGSGRRHVGWLQAAVLALAFDLATPPTRGHNGQLVTPNGPTGRWTSFARRPRSTHHRHTGKTCSRHPGVCLGRSQLKIQEISSYYYFTTLSLSLSLSIAFGLVTTVYCTVCIFWLKYFFIWSLCEYMY